MQDKIKAKELMRDPNCADCDCLLSGDDIVILFQDDRGHDLKDGYFCEKCADKYDEDGIMEKTTAQELIENLNFSKNIDGVSTSITKGHELFGDNLHSWLDNFVSEDWDGDIVTMTPEDGDSWEMTRAEYNKL